MGVFFFWRCRGSLELFLPGGEGRAFGSGLFRWFGSRGTRYGGVDWRLGSPVGRAGCRALPGLSCPVLGHRGTAAPSALPPSMHGLMG